MIFTKIINKSRFEWFHKPFRLSKIIHISLLLSVLFVTTEAKEYTISGIVVDKSGKPMKEVTVVVESKKPSTEIDQLIFSEETDENGHFQIKKEAEVGDVMYLELDPPARANTLNLIQPPFWKKLVKFSNQIFQQKIVFGRSIKIEVGKLRVDFPYPTVELFIVDKNGKPAFNFDEDFFNIWLVIYARIGNSVATENFNSIQSIGTFGVDSSVTLALPRGKWKLKICADPSCEKVFGLSNYFTVKRNKSNITIEVDNLRPFKSNPLQR